MSMIGPNIKIRNLKGTSLAVKAVTKYIKSKQEYMTVMGLKVGKKLHVLFQDARGGLEFWTPNNIIELYTSGHDNMASSIGMDFLKRNKLITSKQNKDIAKARQVSIDNATGNVANGLIQAIEMLKAQKSPKAEEVLAEVRNLLGATNEEE